MSAIPGPKRNYSLCKGKRISSMAFYKNVILGCITFLPKTILPVTILPVTFLPVTFLPL